jgi:hypothetical protein
MELANASLSSFGKTFSSPRFFAIISGFNKLSASNKASLYS